MARINREEARKNTLGNREGAAVCIYLRVYLPAGRLPPPCLPPTRVRSTPLPGTQPRPLCCICLHLLIPSTCTQHLHPTPSLGPGLGLGSGLYLYPALGAPDIPGLISGARRAAPVLIYDGWD